MTDVNFNHMSRDEIIDFLVDVRFEMFAMGLSYDTVEPHWDVVVNDDGNAVAVVSRYYADNSPGDLELLYVLPSVRREGVGFNFLAALVRKYGKLGGECYGGHRAAFFRRAGMKMRVCCKLSSHYRFFGTRKSFPKDIPSALDAT